MSKTPQVEASKLKDLQSWANEHTVGDEMIWKGSFGHQVMFVRDRIGGLINAGRDYEDHEEIRVLGTHRSKSIILPVYYFERKDFGIRFVARENFYNWKLSVLSEKPIEVDLSTLCHVDPPIDPDYTGNPLASVYFEGFPDEWIFDYYVKDKRKFSLEIWGYYPFWTAVHNILKSVGVIQSHKWNTKEEHRKELDDKEARRKARVQEKTQGA